MDAEALAIIEQYYPDHVGPFRDLAASDQDGRLFSDVMQRAGRGLFADQSQEIPPIEQQVIAPLRAHIDAIVALGTALFEQAKQETAPKELDLYQTMFDYTVNMLLAALHLDGLDPNKQAQLFTWLFNMAQTFPVAKTRVHLLKILTVLPTTCTTAAQRLGIFKILVNQICNPKASTCTWPHDNLPVETVGTELLDILMATLCFPEWNEEKAKVFLQAVQATGQEEALLAKCREDRPIEVGFAILVPQPANLDEYKKGTELITAALQKKEQKA